MSWKHRYLNPRMEREIRLVLNEKGYYPMTGREFCLLVTTPDFYFPDLEVAVYLDGRKAHAKREERDRELRDLLRKRYNVKVVEISYEKYTVKERDRVLGEILGAIE